MQFILQYIKNLFTKEFETDFEPSKEDLLALENIKLNKDKEVVLIDNNEVSSDKKEVDTFKNHLSLLIDIYEEVEILEEKGNGFNGEEIYYFRGINYKNSVSYQTLIREPSITQISFLFFLLDIVNNTPKNTLSHFHNRYLSNIFESILKGKVKLSKKEFDKLFLFENENWTYDVKTGYRSCSSSVDGCVSSFDISNYVLLDKAIAYSFNKPLSKKVIKHIQKTYILKVHPSSQRFYVSIKAHRILINSKYIESEIPFFLLPDYFGKKINKLLLKTEEMKAVIFSEILRIHSKKSREFAKSNKKIDELIERIGLDFFEETTLTIIDSVVKFKSHLKIIGSTKYYQKLFEENITIVFALFTTLDRLLLIEKIPSNNLILIIIRSYSLKGDEKGLGNGSMKIGNLCITLLAENYNTEGKEKLQKLYNETKYKRLKNRIDKAL